MKTACYKKSDIIFVKAPVLDMTEFQRRAYFRSIRSSLRKLGNQVVIVPMETAGDLDITLLSHYN